MINIIEFIKSLDEQKTLNLVIAVIILAVFDFFSPLMAKITIKIFNFKLHKKEIKENAFYGPLNGFYRITGIYLVIVFLKNDFGISEEIIGIITRIYKIMLILFISNSLANSITKKSKVINKVKLYSEKELDDSSVKLIIRFIRAFIYIIAVFIIFAEIGYDLSGLITGLGLGSVVLTLAAQDTLKNLFGGIIIFMDKPFKHGDHVKINKYEGVIEDITFRSTRLRTLDNSVVQIPNSLVASESIENITKINNRRYKINLELNLDTKLEKIEILKNYIFKYLFKNENILNDTINVYFDKITGNGYNIVVICYLNVSEYMDYLEVSEQINKGLVSILNKEGIDLAYDTKTIEIKKY